MLLILIGISLSMDTFSLALSFGSFNISLKKGVFFSCMVALFHFLMPLLGNKLRIIISNIIYINTNKLLSIIFIFIAFEMFIDIINNSKEKKFDISIIGYIIYAFSVSIDSFTLGLGISEICLFPIIGSIIFSIISFSFTIIGIKIGKIAYEKIGMASKVLGFIIIICLAIIHFIK